ncbi:DUF4113 domain-containing protein [Pseudomonas sp. 1176_21]|uniref:DUF4113 domain-containing protein n=1 Tax=Pseudomonas sp. 1176_21 TaxID=2604453 RepID=UPI004064ACAB
METIDLLSARFCRGAVGDGVACGRVWEMRREILLPAYTLSWRELPKGGRDF